MVKPGGWFESLLVEQIVEPTEHAARREEEP